MVRLDEVWDRTEEEFQAQISDHNDIDRVREGEVCYLYSTDFMARRYAETAARISSGDIPLAIAETVRSESATYPRPTRVETFKEKPFHLSDEQIAAAMEIIFGDPGSADIGSVRASDGSVFLYSTDHLSAARAQSMAERIAVGLHENP
ncbi:MAG: hypothetical protein ABIG68_13660 [Acidobacteriota bacterium]